MPIAIKMAGKEIASYDTTTDKVAIKLSDDVSIKDSAGNVVLGNSGLTSNVVFPPLGNSAVGTVSESSGTPTGDIIERGSNLNGEYVKYADGTLICFKQNISMTYVNTARIGANYTIPYEFISIPVGMASFNVTAEVENLGYTNAGGALVNRPTSTTGGEVRLYRDDSNFSSGDSCSVSLMWLGRWFT